MPLSYANIDARWERTSSERKLGRLEDRSYVPESIVYSPQKDYIAVIGTTPGAGAVPGRRFAALLNDKGGVFRGDLYEDISSITFTEKGDEIAYVAQSGPNAYKIMGKCPQSTTFEQVKELLFSREGDYLAYAARRGATWLVFVEGKNGQLTSESRNEVVSGLVFVGDGPLLAYIARPAAGGERAVIPEGAQGNKIAASRAVYDRIIDDRILFDRRGEHYAFLVVSASRHYAIIDGREQKSFSWVGELTLQKDQDPTVFTYLACQDGEMLRVFEEIK